MMFLMANNGLLLYIFYVCICAVSFPILSYMSEMVWRVKEVNT